MELTKFSQQKSYTLGLDSPRKGEIESERERNQRYIRKDDFNISVGNTKTHTNTRLLVEYYVFREKRSVRLKMCA